MSGLLEGEVARCLTRLDNVQDALNRISDAGQLPYTQLESQALIQSVTITSRIIEAAELVLAEALFRWGLE